MGFNIVTPKSEEWFDMPYNPSKTIEISGIEYDIFDDDQLNRFGIVTEGQRQQLGFLPLLPLLMAAPAIIRGVGQVVGGVKGVLVKPKAAPKAAAAAPTAAPAPQYTYTQQPSSTLPMGTILPIGLGILVLGVGGFLLFRGKKRRRR